MVKFYLCEENIKALLVGNAIHLIASGGFEKATTKELTYCGGDLPDVKMSILWKHIYDEVIHGVPTPITLEQAMETVRITELVFEKTGFGTPEKFQAAQACGKN